MQRGRLGCGVIGSLAPVLLVSSDLTGSLIAARFELVSVTETPYWVVPRLIICWLRVPEHLNDATISTKINPSYGRLHFPMSRPDLVAWRAVQPAGDPVGSCLDLTGLGVPVIGCSPGFRYERNEGVFG